MPGNVPKRSLGTPMADMGHGTVKIDKLLSQFVYLWRALEGAFEYLVGGN